MIIESHPSSQNWKCNLSYLIKKSVAQQIVSRALNQKAVLPHLFYVLWLMVILLKLILIFFRHLSITKKVKKLVSGRRVGYCFEILIKLVLLLD